MKIKIIKIGNSRGIRIPRVILQQIGISDEVDLKVDRDRIILKPIHRRRTGWRESFQKMSLKSDDQLLDGESTIYQNSWDSNEWTWENE